MAILRGGIRIAGMDIRVGLPRDTSLDNVGSDPRFRRKQGPNSESVMGRFHSYVNEAEGFARKAKFYVEFNLPNSQSLAGDASYTDYGEDAGQKILPTSNQEQDMTFPNRQDLASVHTANGRRVRAFCKSISMPDREVQLKEIRHHGPTRKFAYDIKSAPITATFYADKFLRERSYFELWQSTAFSTQSFNYNFYDNYVSDVNIFQLGSFQSKNERDDVTYAVKLFDCFPKSISAVEYDSATNEVQTFSVTFEFRYWINYFLDRSGNIALGSPNYADVTVKNGGGIFGGILNNLPPELRRAGTDVLEGLKRKIPIGGITGGRAFPPFGNFPPINL